MPNPWRSTTDSTMLTYDVCERADKERRLFQGASYHATAKIATEAPVPPPVIHDACTVRLQPTHVDEKSLEEPVLGPRAYAAGRQRGTAPAQSPTGMARMTSWSAMARTTSASSRKHHGGIARMYRRKGESEELSPDSEAVRLSVTASDTGCPPDILARSTMAATDESTPK